MTNRIDHTGHNHPATPAARKACRDELRAADARIAAHYAAFPVAPVDPLAAIVVRDTTPAARAARSSRRAADRAAKVNAQLDTFAALGDM